MKSFDIFEKLRIMRGMSESFDAEREPVEARNKNLPN